MIKVKLSAMSALIGYGAAVATLVFLVILSAAI